MIKGTRNEKRLITKRNNFLLIFVKYSLFHLISRPVFVDFEKKGNFI